MRTPDLMLMAVQALATCPTYYLEKQSTNPFDTLHCYPGKQMMDVSIGANLRLMFFA